MTARSRKLKKHAINLHAIRQSFKLFLRFNKYILRYWKFEVFILVLGNLSIILQLAVPFVGKNALDKGILAKDTRIFVIFALLGGGIYFMNLMVNNIHRYLNQYVTIKIMIDISKDVFKKVGIYTLRFFQTKPTGSYIFSIINDTSNACQIINNTLPSLITTIFKLVSITAIIIFINWKILVLILLYQFVVLLQINLFTERIVELTRSNLEKSEGIFEKLREIFSHIYIVKVFGTITREMRGYFHNLIDRMRLEIKETKLRICSDILRGTTDKLFFGIIGFYGSFLVIKGELTLGSLGAVMIYITQGIGAYATFLNLSQQIVINRISLGRVAALFDVKPEITEEKNAKNVIFPKGKIEFRNVTFGYKKNKYVLDNINFSILSGVHVAIVGHSGCGKTTILNLILRLYDVNKGSVLLDGYSIKDIKFKSLYRQIGLAPQEQFLWNDTVAYNILYGAQDASEEEMVKAAKISEAHNFILNLPKQYDSKIGEMACKISEGQKQRIALARAIIKNPRILILDEAMSSLDSQTEDKIIENIKRKFKESTVITVSHRLSTVKRMDLVYFFESPHRIDIGNHKELIEKSQKYRELFASQIESDRILDSA